MHPHLRASPFAQVQHPYTGNNNDETEMSVNSREQNESLTQDNLRADVEYRETADREVESKKNTTQTHSSDNNQSGDLVKIDISIQENPSTTSGVMD